jgi:hypothetical protein
MPITASLTSRRHLLIDLAVSGASCPADAMLRQDLAAWELGLSGAEIDLARQGHSFDIRENNALAVVLTYEMPTRSASGRRSAGRCNRASMPMNWRTSRRWQPTC